MLESLIELELLCPMTIVRGNRIVRMSGNVIGKFELGYQALFELGSENIGVLIGGNVVNDRFATLLQEIRNLELRGTVVVVTSSNALANMCYSELADGGALRIRPDVFETGSVILTTPERLRKINSNYTKTRPLLGVISLDPNCIVHQARGGSWGNNDRPQHIAKFRYEHRRGEWQPPLLIMTTKQPKSLNTIQMLAAYGLEAWWFVDAATLRMASTSQSIEMPNATADI